jgi:hypothetical protein
MDFRYKTLENGFWILENIKYNLKTNLEKGIVIELSSNKTIIFHYF